MIFILVGVICVLLYFYSTRNFNYWKNKNVVYEQPIPLFGNHLQVLIGKLSEADNGVRLYRKYTKERFVGCYRGNTPDLIIRDPELVKQILSVDFSYFHARGVGRDYKTEPLLLNIFSVDGDYWKLLRHRLTPAFTSSKLRGMFPIIVKCSGKLHDYAETIADTESDIDAWELMARFSMEFIGACGFGIEMDTLGNEHTSFLKLGKIIFARSKFQRLLMGLRILFPDLTFIQKLYIADVRVQEVILDIVMKVREQRNCKPSGRNDFIDLLLELEAMGKIKGESLDEKNPDGTPKEVELEMDLLCTAAQVFIFFAAGFETSSSATSFTLHQLAYHPDIQFKIQNEIDDVMAKYNNQMCFDAINEMTLLDLFFKESMRIFPPAGYTSRICTKTYTIPGSDVTIDPGVRVFIPIQALHLDPNYYDNPTEFQLDRFSDDNFKDRHRYVYLPYGEGPRKCIGYRLGHMQSMVGLASLLQRFTVVPAPSSQYKHKPKPTSYLVQSVEGGLPIRLKGRHVTEL